MAFAALFPAVSSGNCRKNSLLNAIAEHIGWGQHWINALHDRLMAYRGIFFQGKCTFHNEDTLPHIFLLVLLTDKVRPLF